MKNIFCFLIFTTCLLNTELIAQDPGVVPKIDTTFELSGESFKKSYKIEIPKGTDYLAMNVKGTIEGGVLKVWFANPNGHREYGITLKASKKSKSRGTMEEVNGPPKPGTWTLYVENKNAKGEVKVRIH